MGYEVYLLDTHKVVQYFGQGDELHLAFNFPPLYAPWDAHKWRRQIERADTIKRVEDLYLPFRPKKQTLATKAREQGLGPLAEETLAQDKVCVLVMIGARADGPRS